MNITCFHLYNDYSGSPKVLRNIVEGLLDKKHKVTIVTSKTNGVLNDLFEVDNLNYEYFNYHPSSNKFLWICHFIYAQVSLFLKALKYQDSSVFYINTIMPVGAAIAGRLLNKKVVYHYHENAFIKSSFYRVLYRIMLIIADEIICVSKYQRSFLPQSNNISVVYNALPESFICKLVPNMNKAFNKKNILMVSSLVLYKSPIEFITLAQKLPLYKFTLVLNDTQTAIENFISKYNIKVPNNIKIYPRQSDIIRFYNEASILFNLSNRKKIIETFGMTALEGMSAGIPVIVPTVGGIAELVDDDINGYKIDVQQLDIIADRIKYMLSDIDIYSELAKGALTTAALYSNKYMCEGIETILVQ